MKKVHEKSVILGIGIGMIITAIAGMIYSAGAQKEPSKEEIIRLAKGYGLVEQVKIINDQDPANSSNIIKSNDIAGEKTTDGEIKSDKQNGSKAPEKSEGTNGKVADSPNAKDADNNALNQDLNDNSRNIIVEIKNGYRSQNVIDLLLEKDIISDREAFIKVLDSYDAATKINIGTYKFKKNDDMDYVVKTICNIK